MMKGKNMKCKKCGTEFSEGIFCPECGTRYDDKINVQPNLIEKKVKSKVDETKKWYQSSFVVIALLILFCPVGIYLMWKYKRSWKFPIKAIVTIFLVCILWAAFSPSDNKDSSDTVSTMDARGEKVSNKSQTQKVVEKVHKKKSNKRSIQNMKKQFDGKVTKDYLPGTYMTKDGKIFAIDIYDDSILSINPTLAKVFQGQTWSSCSVILPNVAWLQESATVDVADDSIKVDNDSTVYTFKVKGKNLTLKYGDENLKFIKISDEYNAAKAIDTSKIKIENIVGCYCEQEGTSTYVIQIKKRDDKSIDVYYAEAGIDKRVNQIDGAIENVPYEAFAGNKWVYIVADDVCKPIGISFDARNSVGIQGGLWKLLKIDNQVDLSQMVSEYKREHPNIDYQYKSYSNHVKTFVNEAEDIELGVYIKWYDIYDSFQNGIGTVQFKSVGNGKINIIYNENIILTFDENDCRLGDSNDSLVYTCQDGTEFEYYPDEVRIQLYGTYEGSYDANGKRE